ncbi:hypothetical protein [Halomonas sp.]|uniref:hypothetical protein n=1 Tax=Halomonas sp. TaxID=1486246 RepID=UPI00298E4F36|nr:hypothetical protein [Halomonas sp.]MDW7663137.1 hypothetical protein [Bacillota bacterium]MDW7749081.1 hypothetical protein [Halomonas sp.]
MNFYYVTPCGGGPEEALVTCCSVVEVAKKHPNAEFYHFFVLNNGACPLDTSSLTFPGNYNFVEIDINPVGCRAEARNIALKEIATMEHGLVNFLDSGDLLLGDIVTYFLESGVGDGNYEKKLFSCSAIIKGEQYSSIRNPKPVNLIKIINPFYIGATYVDSWLAIRIPFRKGRKEDWKYWLEIKDLAREIKLLNVLAYVYNIKSRRDHLRRKAMLVKDQYQFFRRFLGLNSVLSVGALVAHYSILIYFWFVAYKNQH